MTPKTKLAYRWLQEMATCLPEIHHVLERARSDVLVIGAGVFGLYEAQGWILPLRRKTGDLDLSVGLVSGDADYDRLKNLLIQHGYAHHESSPAYRYFSPKVIPNMPSYIDLLAHPDSADISPTQAIHAMGAGPEFTFRGFPFVQTQRHEIMQRVFYPNPIGFMALKQTSYRDDPVRRIKDLADIVELAYGLVQKGTHFEIPSLWLKLRSYPEAQSVRSMLAELAGDVSVEWDLQDARQELWSRTFDAQEIEETIPASIAELVSYLEV